MSVSSYCQSCCIDCYISPPSPTVVNSPFSLGNLFAAGAITFQVPVEKQHQFCDHTHAEDGRHHFKPDLLLPLLSDAEDLTFVRELEFLIKQKFISATYYCSPSNQMVLHIYFIPYDLGGMKGALRIRKENVLGPGRRFMRNLLRRLLCDIEKSCLIPNTKDNRTLAEIYTDLSSPNPVSEGLDEIGSRLLDFEDELEGLGMRSKLYRYQRRSVAAMLRNELDPRTRPDPLYIPFRDSKNKLFYLQPGTMEVLNERQETAPCRGGILCEELGTGKTVMILSLIVTTRSQISDVEPHIVDTRHIMTPLSFRHFPSGNFATARKQYLPKTIQRKPVPSLVELMLHQARVKPNCNIPSNYTSRRYNRNREKTDEVDTLPLGEILHANTPFYFHHLVEPTDRDRTQRRSTDKRPRVMYLTSATLIVVPANLLSQWDREISKHCLVPLRVLLLRAKTPVPNVQSLAADYDIILMSYTRFTSEANNSDISKLHTHVICTCPEIEGSRVPRCTCQIAGVSPFLQIRWKRLVIDEGHVSSSLSTHLVPFSKLLSVERRWIVTGTPTTNLLGLSLGSKSAEESKSNHPLQRTPMEVDHPTGDTDTDDTIGMPITTSSSSSSSSSPAPHSTSLDSEAHNVALAPETRTRIWNKYDREDLNKLGNMITHFIAVPQFNADAKLIATHVTEPLLDPQGPRLGAIQVLNQIMEMVMIRHRIEDVEKDVILPPVSQESVLLDLDPYVIKSFNALQAIILINAIDSQRTDQDYMFHPRNADALQDTVRNMSQICFWHVDDHLYNAEDLVQNTDKQIQRATDRNTPVEEITALKEALNHLRIALEDPLWKLMQTHEDVPYRVADLNEEIYHAWTRTPGPEPHSSARQTGFLHADRLLKLRDLVIARPLVKEDKIIETGGIVAQRDFLFRKAYEESQHRKNKSRKKSKSSDDSSRIADNFAKKATAAETLREMQKELEMTLKRIEEEEENDGVSLTPSHVNGTQMQTPSALLASSPVRTLRVGSSASAKLNYIINEVQQYSPTEKILIFSESPLSLAHVAEALELIQVKFLRFTTQVNPQIREQLVLTFETSETYRVFLMELKHGARGLNLISASRVIFCEPVWQADVESQAIKRAHRIGQMRPITVKTLAIRGTAEENMVARKAILKNSQDKLPKVIEEAGMRQFIANPKFITHPPLPTPIEPFPLIQLPPEFLEPRPQPLMLRIPVLKNNVSPSMKRVRVEDPIAEELVSPVTIRTSDGSPLQKKKKSLHARFATPS